MGLTTPELDLLREALAENPGDPVFLDVATELIQRTRWTEAVEVLYQGVSVTPERVEAWQVLVDAAFYDAQYERALWAIEHLGADPEESPHLLRRSIECLVRLGRLEEAREAAESYLRVHADDEEVLALLPQLTRSGPPRRLAALDPFYSVERAEEYVAVGRPDRAFRVLRRVLFHHPGDAWVSARLREMSHGPYESLEDDLSEEIDLLSQPPELFVPSPGLASSTGSQAARLPDQFGSSSDEGFEDEATVVGIYHFEEQETQPDRLPAGARELLLSEAGRAGEHARGTDEIEDEDTEEVEAPPLARLVEDDEQGIESVPASEDVASLTGGEVGSFLGRSAERRRRRSLLKS